ncbi:TetR/AcrR family transcriptional regulator [Nocardiopsis gilva YIM 90087]|uniref:TetR/AcrR family transcriptional regulator n=1 Tax=Nocardiopsis gilva YIM 90087 TaxID=1235441 RepID=A0A223SE06_9ACTN|nr:TetR/AcrR family transcriptional regulator [Nocardiopsis gilva]ASU86326.1 TetR/AcrR family transcriptional regulator [Nocardiopsis gilva YIM 90087]
MTADLSPHDTRLADHTLDAATTLFARHGPHGLGMASLTREIIERTGTDIIEFRRAFPTRLDLMYAVALRSTRELVACQISDSSPSETPVTRLSHLIRRHIDHCWKHRTEEELRRTLLPTLRAIHPVRYRELSEQLRLYREHIREIIADGVDEGRFCVAGPGIAAGTVLETLESILNWYDPEGGLSLPELGDVYVDLVIHHQLGCPRR